MNEVEYIQLQIRDNDVAPNFNSYFDEAYQRVSESINEHNQLGYKVISVTPITNGAYDFDSYSDSSSYGYGYSFTTGIMIVYEKIDKWNY